MKNYMGEFRGTEKTAKMTQLLFIQIRFWGRMVVVVDREGNKQTQ